LPQWLSGYAFLFDTESNLQHAKELRKMMAASAPGAAQALRISMDGNSELSKLIAERVVVDARAAGFDAANGEGEHPARWRWKRIEE
jgi:hypothetical protein